jgi:SAM-dependent methyltransferase
MERLRSGFPGVWNIVRFNWHFYAIACGLLLLVALVYPHLPASLQLYAGIGCALAITTLLISLLVSGYIYDYSDLYQLNWLDALQTDQCMDIVNIHAGFDETSVLLEHKFPHATLRVLDFYNPEKHTEISIQRARKARPPYPGTIQVDTSDLPLVAASADMILLLLAAHEIRNEAERVVFFRHLHRVVKPSGRIVVTEHLRDTPNFLAYTIGFLHFHSKKTWLQTFRLSGLSLENEIKITPFISTFILKKHGDAS